MEAFKGVVHYPNYFFSIDYSCLAHLNSIVFFVFVAFLRGKNYQSKLTPIDSDLMY